MEGEIAVVHSRFTALARGYPRYGTLQKRYFTSWVNANAPPNFKCGYLVARPGELDDTDVWPLALECCGEQPRKHFIARIS